MNQPKAEEIIAAIRAALAKKMIPSEMAAYQQWSAKHDYLEMAYSSIDTHF